MFLKTNPLYGLICDISSEFGMEKQCENTQFETKLFFNTEMKIEKIASLKSF